MEAALPPWAAATTVHGQDEFMGGGRTTTPAPHRAACRVVGHFMGPVMLLSSSRGMARAHACIVHPRGFHRAREAVTFSRISWDIGAKAIDVHDMPSTLACLLYWYVLVVQHTAAHSSRLSAEVTAGK